ncbi:MAG: hypothetical protein HYW88_02200, partial [Candidatus Sungbacteria bacterium]|nr:hypothetical protein [Candidatus Sungbacteria bacterium]
MGATELEAITRLFFTNIYDGIRRNLVHAGPSLTSVTIVHDGILASERKPAGYGQGTRT